VVDELTLVIGKWYATTMSIEHGAWSQNPGGIEHGAGGETDWNGETQIEKKRG
jgi:hypothetical protein